VTTTYTIAILDVHGNPQEYIRPNFSNPAKALAKLRTEQQHRKGVRLGVVRLAMDWLTEDDLEDEIEQEKSR